MTLFLQNKELVAVTIILLLLSILCRFITGIFLNTLIRETENMATTNNRLLLQCKVKFRNCYKLNDGVPNIPVFVERFLGRIQMGKFTVDGIAHFSGQLMLFSVVAAGLGACKGIAEGKTAGEIIPFYLLSFLGLYLYFSVSGLVNLDGKRELLKVSLTDYLENHMAPRLAVLDEAEMLDEIDKVDIRQKSVTERAFQKQKRPHTEERGAVDGAETLMAEQDFSRTGNVAQNQALSQNQAFSQNQEKELEELLKEFFA